MPRRTCRTRGPSRSSEAGRTSGRSRRTWWRCTRRRPPERGIRLAPGGRRPNRRRRPLRRPHRFPIPACRGGPRFRIPRGRGIAARSRIRRVPPGGEGPFRTSLSFPLDTTAGQREGAGRFPNDGMICSTAARCLLSDEEATSADPVADSPASGRARPGTCNSSPCHSRTPRFRRGPTT